MRSIFIGSTGAGPGQTLAAWALALRLRDRGMRVGFFKPYGMLPEPDAFSTGQICDPDVLLMRSVLDLTEPLEALCPVTPPDLQAQDQSGSGAEVEARIRDAFRKVAQGKDAVLILGAKEIFFGGVLAGPSDSALVKSFDASVLLVDRYQRESMTLYSLLSLNSFLDGRVKTAIVNHVPEDKMGRVKEKILPFLKEKGLHAVGLIPEDPVLSALSISAISDLLQARILCCPEFEANLIETFTIGSRELEGLLAIFKQVYNKIILAGLKGPGERGRPIGGIVLTGGKPPSEAVLNAARGRCIPLMLTRADTFQAMERLEKTRPPLGPKDGFKVQRFLALLEKEMGPNWINALL